MKFPCGQNRHFLTINSDLAVTIGVTGLEEHLGLSIGQSSGTGREVLQEQPGESDQREIFSIVVNVGFLNKMLLISLRISRWLCLSQRKMIPSLQGLRQA